MKFFKFLFTFLILILFVVKAEALSFSEGFRQISRTPLVVLVYADWATNYQTHLNVIRELKKNYGNRCNFVELNIANDDAKSFNSRFNIYTNLPYMLMFKDGGKVSRFVQRDCSVDYSCVNSRIKTFLP